MRRIDAQYLEAPFYGSRKMSQILGVNRKRVQRLMRLMGLQAIYPKRRTTQPAAGHKIYPYLLRDVDVTRPNQVWSSDITYVPLRHGFMYLVAVLDWYSRYVLSWRLSNTLDGAFCLAALDAALARGQPEIFNTDQGSQFTATVFTSRLESCSIAISMDGPRWPDQRWQQSQAPERQSRHGRRVRCRSRVSRGLLLALNRPPRCEVSLSPISLIRNPTKTAFAESHSM